MGLLSDTDLYELETYLPEKVEHLFNKKYISREDVEHVKLLAQEELGFSVSYATFHDILHQNGLRSGVLKNRY